MRLSKWMKDHKMTGRELARRLQIEEAALSRIRNRTREPSLHIAQRIEVVTMGFVTIADLELPKRKAVR